MQKPVNSLWLLSQCIRPDTTYCTFNKGMINLKKEKHPSIKEVCVKMNVLLFAVILLFTNFNVSATEAPKILEGDFWVFNVQEKDFIGSSSSELDGAYEVRFEGGSYSLYKIEGGKKAEWPYESGKELCRMVNGCENEKDNPRGYLKYSHAKAEKIAYKARRRGARNETLRIAENIFVGHEEKKLPGRGVCKTDKIKREDAGPARSLWVYTYNYCPDTHSIVSFSYDSSIGSGIGGKRVIELVDYGHAKRGNGLAR